ncbi:hypothetical protein [Thermoleptolyngbya sp.]
MLLSSGLWLCFRFAFFTALLLGAQVELKCDRPTLETMHCQTLRRIESVPIGWQSVTLKSAPLSETAVIMEPLPKQVYTLRIGLPRDSVRSITAIGLGVGSDPRHEMQLGLWGDRARAQAAADEIQRFMLNPARSSLSIVSEPIFWMDEIEQFAGLELFPILYMASWGLLFIRAQQSQCEFDRSTGELRLKFWGLRSGNKTLALADIEQVAIGEVYLENSTAYKVFVVMKNGDRHPLEPCFSSELASVQAAAETVRAFLNLPPVQVLSRKSPKWLQA